MIIKYNISIDNESINNSIKRIINQTYKLLPMREENINWQKPLETLIEQIGGMKRLFLSQQETFFCLLCKMEGLFELKQRKQFPIYRRTIFECLSLLNSLQQHG